MSCSNNMVQISLALHHHDFNLEHLPDGVTAEQGPIRNEVKADDHIGWMAHILPYIEQQNAYEKLDLKAGAYSDENAEVRSFEVPTFRCPSNPTTYGFNRNDSVGTSDYAGCHNDSEAPIDTDNNGVFFMNSSLRFAQITDGTSNTILLGETLGDKDRLGWITGTRATLRNTGGFVHQSMHDFEQSELGALEVGGFDSYHQGGGNFAMADGAVIFLTNSIDEELYRRLGNRADGELIGEQLNY